MAASGRIRTALRRLALLLALLLSLTIIPIVALQLSAVRGYVLDRLVHQATQALPGTFEVQQAAWPSLGRLVLENVRWEVAGESLAAVEEFEVRWDPWTLVRRELRLPRVLARVSKLDAPGIKRALSETSTSTGSPAPDAPPENESGRLPWIRQGALGGLPSIELQQVSIEVRDASITDSLRIESLLLRFHADLRQGKMPNIGVEQLQLKLQDPAVEISQGSLNVDLQSGRLQAELLTREGSAWNLAVTTDTSDPQVVDLQVQVGHADSPPLSLLSLRGDLVSSQERVEGLRFTSQIHTPGVALLRQLPFLQPSLQSIPDLQGIRMRSEGSLAWLPSWRLDVTSQIESNDWLEGGGVRVRLQQDSLLVSDLELQLADVILRGEALRAPEAALATVRLQVSGTEWMSTLAPDVTPPDSLAVDVDATVHQQKDAMQFAATVRAGVAQASTRIDDLRLEVASTSLSLRDLLFRWRTRAHGWELAGAGQVVVADSLLLVLEPLQVQAARAAELPGWLQPLREPRSKTRISWQAERGLRVTDVGIQGDLGEALLNGRWQADSGGRMKLAVAWPRPPQILVDAIADSTRVMQLRRGWTDDELPHAEITTRLTRQAARTEVQATGSLTLPGPRIFAEALPESIQVQDLDAVRATFEAQMRSDSLHRSWHLALDLDDTAWLDSSGVFVQARDDSVFLESLRLMWDGLDVRVSGVADSTAVDLFGALQFDARRFIERMPSGPLAHVVVQSAATWHLQGPPESADLDAQVQTSIESPWGKVSQAVASVEIRKGTLQTANLDTPAGLLVQGLQWERLHLDLRPERVGAVDGSRLRLSLAAEQQELGAVLWIDPAQTRTVRTDSLYLRVFDRDLRSDQPFLLQAGGGDFELRDMQLSGSLGLATADWIVRTDTLAGLVNLDLQLPDRPDLLQVPTGLWPQTLRLRVAAADNDSISMFLQTAGLQLGQRSQLSVVADVHATPDSTDFRIDVVDPRESVLESRGVLPLQWTLRPLSFAVRPDSLRFVATFLEFPIPDLSGDPRAAVDFFERSSERGGAHLNGKLQVSGPLAQPRGHGYLTLRPQEENLQDYKVHVFVALARQGTPWGRALQTQLDRLSTRDLLTAPGAKLALWVQRDSVRVLDAAAHLPVDIGFEAGALKVQSDAHLRAAICATRVKLSELSPLLPPGTSFDGVLSADLKADGPWRDPGLSGGFRFTDLAARVPDGSRVRASGNIDLQGTARDPGVQGQVTIRDGLIRIPELPRSLLPLDDKALLLSDTTLSAAEPLRPAATPGLIAADSTRSQRDGKRRQAAAEASLKTQRRDKQAMVDASANNSDVSVKIPGALWIRGRGFEVELSGDLQLTVRDGLPRVVGELKAQRGDLQLMASKFPIKSGRVMFFGDDETNPSLDLVMGRQYEDVSVEVVVQGTAKEPRIEFRSEPQLTEDEILSYVLFGRGTSQLDETQAQKYDERVLALASLLTSNLGEGIRTQTGVDMIGFEQSQDTADRASLVVGKYLSPRVLLKYVQDLERGQGYAVNVEYWLTGGLRLMTSSSRYNQSGMELNWSHDY